MYSALCGNLNNGPEPNIIFTVGIFFALEKGINMEYKLEKCPSCHRTYAVSTEELVSSCPHCRDSEHLALLTDPKWLKLDDHEQNLYKNLKKLNERIEVIDKYANPKKPPKTPWTRPALICWIFIIVVLIAIPVVSLILHPDEWKQMVIIVGCMIPVFAVFVIMTLISRRKDRATLKELYKEQEEYYEAIAGVQAQKGAYREEWLAKQTETE